MGNEPARITFNPKQMGGQACIRGLRIPVATVVRCVAAGMSTPEILAAYPDLEAADIKALGDLLADTSANVRGAHTGGAESAGNTL